jgi:hypothetical protein
MSNQFNNSRKLNKKLIIGLSIPVGLLLPLLVYFIFFIYLTPVFYHLKPLPKFPATVSIYKMVKQDITLQYARDLSTKFGFTGDVKEGPESFSISDQPNHKYLNIYRFTGAIDYYYDPFILSQYLKLPSYEEALSIAVKKLKETELMQTDEYTSNVMSGGSEDIIVSIKYPVSGHPLGGVGYTVRVGHLGQIVKVSGNPAMYVVDRQEKLKPISQAYRELTKTKRKYTGLDCWVSIDDVSISYWRESKYLPQDYLYPYYRFTGSRSQRIPYMKAESYFGAIPATAGSPLVFPGISAVPDINHDKSNPSVFYPVATAGLRTID